jgi:hypothetical protein
MKTQLIQLKQLIDDSCLLIKQILKREEKLNDMYKQRIINETENNLNIKKENR